MKIFKRGKERRRKKRKKKVTIARMWGFEPSSKWNCWLIHKDHGEKLSSI